MKAMSFFFCLVFAFVVIANNSSAQTRLSANGDTMYVSGGTLAGLENAGSLETAVNGDTASNGTRLNPNRVYALYEGQYYLQQNALDVVNPTGTLTFVGVPSASGHTKPVWLMQGINGPIIINGNSDNVVYGSLKFENIHYVGQQLDGTFNNENFMCGTQNQLPQSLTINNCLFEFTNIDMFDCTNESGAIGGWPYGAKFRITNSYFRNLLHADQWWASRIFQCKHPIDTCWVENVTVSGGGLTFLQQNQLTDFAYFNHNTFVNQHKYWKLSPYVKTFILTNNIFLNQNWVGEDSTVTNSGQDPDGLFMSTVDIDTVNYTNKVGVQQKYYAGDSAHYSADLALNKLKVFVSNNIDYWNPLLLDYFTNKNNLTMDSTTGYVLSWLDWGSGFTLPQRLNNMPGEWMNSRTQALFAAYAPPNGGFVAETPKSEGPGSPTVDNIDAATRDIMMQWNQNKYSDPHWPNAPDAYHSKMVFGDFDPTTIPGIASPTDPTAYPGGENGIGIAKFTDLTENWNSTVMSTIDNLPLGALIWNDAQMASFSSAADLKLIDAAYVTAGGKSITAVHTPSSVPTSFSLSQNYPNPFNPSTTINFSIAKTSNVRLTVYNVLGQKVATLVDGNMEVGEHSAVFDASKFASGIYFYRLDAGEFSSVKKMILLK
jgi:hypothetical protein